MNLSDLIDKRFEVKTTHQMNPLVSSIETSATKFLQNNPKRVAFTIVNLSANKVYILPDLTVATDKGIVLAAGGGSYVSLYNEDFQMTGFEWYGIAVGASNILVIEVIIV